MCVIRAKKERAVSFKSGWATNETFHSNINANKKQVGGLLPDVPFRFAHSYFFYRELMEGR